MLATAAGLAILGVSDVLMVHEITGRGLDPRYAVLGIVRDWMAVMTWAIGYVRRTVVWRGNSFTIGPGSLLLPCGADDSEAQTEEVEV